MEYDLYSYDLFDTVITRSTLNPEGIFAVMQSRFGELSELSEIAPELAGDFVYIRKNAEASARKKTSKEEITLNEIYAIIKRNYCLSDAETLCLIKLEEETEIFCSLPLQLRVDEILSRIKAGQRVVFISDMYLSHEVIRKMLDKISSDLSKIPLYLSSEIGYTKASGNLFNYVKTKEKVNFNRWIHYGDNFKSDYKIPNKFGITAKWLKQSEISGFFKYLNKAYYNSTFSLMLGCAQAAIKNSGDLSDNKLYRTGALCAGPVFSPFADWILRQSLKKGISHLYFIARDGFIIKRIADRIIEKFSINIKTSYIYSSRQAWDPKTKEQRELLALYGKQQIKPNVKSGFVDIWGTGGSLKHFCDLCNLDLGKITLFLYGTYFYQDDALGFERVIFAQHLKLNGHIEFLAKAPEGQCIGFKLEKNIVIPVCREQEKIEIEKFGFSQYLSGIVDFVNYWIIFKNRTLGQNNELYRLIDSLISKFLFFASEDELHYFLNFPDYPKSEKNLAVMRPLRIFKYKLKIFVSKIKFIEKSKILSIFRD